MMVMMRKIEDFFSNHMDRILSKKFSQPLHLRDIEERLNEEFQLKKTQEEDKRYIPDQYTIILAEDDYQKLNALATYQRLYQFIMQALIKNDFYVKNDPVIQLASNMIKESGSFSVQALSTNELMIEEGDDALNHTVVFQKGFLKKAAVDYSQLTFSRLNIVEGDDKGTSIAVGKRRIHVGRRESNEVFLHDINCSRLHAYIYFENYRHVLYDAGSLNGTYVNGNAVKKHQLKFGDRIAVGNTVIVYDSVFGKQKR